MAPAGGVRQHTDNVPGIDLSKDEQLALADVLNGVVPPADRWSDDLRSACLVGSTRPVLHGMLALHRPARSPRGRVGVLHRGRHDAAAREGTTTDTACVEPYPTGSTRCSVPTTT